MLLLWVGLRSRGTRVGCGRMNHEDRAEREDNANQHKDRGDEELDPGEGNSASQESGPCVRGSGWLAFSPWA